MQAVTDTDSQALADESPHQLAHIDARGYQVVADHSGCYADESGTSKTAVPVATCMVPERSANELLHQMLAFAPAEGALPMRLFRETYGEEQCFIKLFGGSSRPNTSSSDFLIAKHGICNADRCFAGNLENIFFKFFKHELLGVLRASNLSLKKAVQGNVTALDVLNPLYGDYLCAHDLGQALIKSIRSYPDYKANKKEELFAMIRQLGSPSFSMTLSTADTRWEELITCLHSVAKGAPLAWKEFAGMSHVRKIQLIAGDPVTCARVYSRRIEFFQTWILLCSIVLGNVMDYAGIDEFQARGAPDTHMMLWNKDAPIKKQDNKAEVIAFYDQHVTTASDLVPSKLAGFKSTHIQIVVAPRKASAHLDSQIHKYVLQTYWSLC